MRYRNFKALCPAGNDWRAVYLHTKEPWFSLERIAVFALIRPDEHAPERSQYPHLQWEPANFDTVEGLVSAGEEGLRPAPEDSNFYEYVHVDDIMDEDKALWAAAAQERAAAKRHTVEQREASPPQEQPHMVRTFKVRQLSSNQEQILTLRTFKQ